MERDRIGSVLGEKIRYCRKAYKMTQQMLGEALSINRSCLVRYEQGSSLPKISFLLDFSRYFDVSLDDLLDDKISADLFTSMYKGDFKNIECEIISIDCVI